jgi:hypothetical protein
LGAGFVREDPKDEFFAFGSLGDALTGYNVRFLVGPHIRVVFEQLHVNYFWMMSAAIFCFQESQWRNV